MERDLTLTYGFSRVAVVGAGVIGEAMISALYRIGMKINSITVRER